MDEKRLEQQIAFIMEADKIKKVMRQTYLSDQSRRENDAEHSWHLALMAALLAEYSNVPVNVEHVMFMVLIHDMVEIDAGDTYAYDPVGNATKREREEKAADRIFHILPDDQAGLVRELWEEFEACETPEAKFANTLDKIQPLLLNDASDGRAWKEHEVYVKQVLERNLHTGEGSQALWDYGRKLIDRNVEQGYIRREEP